jgi:membrane associated rhomboid family serine protease
VYVLSGVFGNVFSSFVQIEAAAKEEGATLKLGVGASGSVLGLFGGELAFLWSTWSRRDADQRLSQAIILLISLVITFAVGTVAPSKIDNWAHFGGLAAGFSFGLLMHLRNFPAACVKSRVFALLLGALGVVMKNFFQKFSM